MVKRIAGMFRLSILIPLICLLIFILPRLITTWFSRKLIFDLEDAPKKQAAIVFGAGLWRDGRPTPVLRDRVATAAQLYFSGKVKKLLMSGDNQYVDYNEPASMQAYALELGVPKEDIVLDYAGHRTYDTCFRARHIFKLDDVILVSQGFHIPRALLVCNALGISAIGVPADHFAQQAYRQSSLIYWHLREVPATLVALWEVYISQPLPVLGDPEPIFPLEAQ